MKSKKQFSYNLGRIAVSCIIATFLLLVSMLCLAEMIDHGVVGSEVVKYYIVLSMILAAAVGTCVLGREGDRLNWKKGIFFGPILWLLLVAVNAVFWDAQYHGMTETFILLSGSSIATSLISLRLRKPLMKSYIKRRYR